jgi:hypothetical protein
MVKPGVAIDRHVAIGVAEVAPWELLLNIAAITSKVVRSSPWIDDHAVAWQHADDLGVAIGRQDDRRLTESRAAHRLACHWRPANLRFNGDIATIPGIKARIVGHSAGIYVTSAAGHNAASIDESFTGIEEPILSEHLALGPPVLSRASIELSLGSGVGESGIANVASRQFPRIVNPPCPIEVGTISRRRQSARVSAKIAGAILGPLRIAHLAAHAFARIVHSLGQIEIGSIARGRETLRAAAVGGSIAIAKIAIGSGEYMVAPLSPLLHVGRNRPFTALSPARGGLGAELLVKLGRSCLTSPSTATHLPTTAFARLPELSLMGAYSSTASHFREPILLPRIGHEISAGAILRSDAASCALLAQLISVPPAGLHAGRPLLIGEGPAAGNVAPLCHAATANVSGTSTKSDSACSAHSWRHPTHARAPGHASHTRRCHASGTSESAADAAGLPATHESAGTRTCAGSASAAPLRPSVVYRK